MNYLENRVIYYSIFISKLTSIKCTEVFDKINRIFLINDKNKQKLLDLINDSTFIQLNSMNTTNMYLNYIKSFGKQDDFGKIDSQLEAISIKKSVMAYIEELKRTPINNALMVLNENYEKMQLSVLYALSIYVQHNEASQTCLTVLKKAVKEIDGIDACLSLMCLDKDKKQEWFEVLRKNTAIELYPALSTEISNFYQNDIGVGNEKKSFWEVK